ncbi:MAG: hypothetical protein HYX79_06100 [Chloroflexi bacterium]|nr:hypothetical protein [Chloroflexota bacterium]
MREISDTLLSAQKKASRTPYVRVEASNKVSGVVRLDWERLYTGTEDDYYHAVTLSGDGSLVRVRITLPADSRKLYRQRVAGPGPQSDFSQWVYTNEYNAVVVACCSLGAEVSIFWVKSDKKIYHLKSTDYGASWGSPELLGYTPTTAINGIAAAYKPNGDIALFYADQATLYVMKRLSGNWGSATAWDKSTGDLSGVACVYVTDWDLLVSGKDTNDNFKLWTLVYGDGGEVESGTWSALEELASAPADGNFEYRACFLDKPDVYRCFFVESFNGAEAYNRPFWSHIVPGASFPVNLWREPVPFNLSSEYGLAIAHPPEADYCWLSNPKGVWRAPLAAQSLDLTADVIKARQEATRESGKLSVELRNDEGQYASPGSGGVSVLVPGCELAFSPGYVTARATETLRPSAAGDEEDIHNATSGTGNHWQDVDDGASDEDTTIIWENTADNDYYRDLYGLPDFDKKGAINSVTVYARCRSFTSALRPNLKIACKTGGTVYESSEFTTGSAYANYSKVWATNPNTGLPWTEDDINNLQVGVAMRDAATPPNIIATICTQVFAVVDYGGGNEVGSGQTYILDALEYTSSAGKTSLLLHARDGWSLAEGWQARHQFRWNKSTEEMSVKSLLAFVLARCGLKLDVKSQSSVVTGFYPDFTINPGNRGDVIIKKLLSFVPDVLFIEGNSAFLVNPLAADTSIYSYGTNHPISEGSYRNDAAEFNRVQVEGYDPAGDIPIIVNTFDWAEIGRLYDRLKHIEDRNIDTVERASERGEAWLRHADIESASAVIRIPVNCSQQLYDVVDLTDSRAGLSAEKKRVLGLALSYDPARGEYAQRLSLGGV